MRQHPLVAFQDINTDTAQLCIVLRIPDTPVVNIISNYFLSIIGK